MSWDFIQLKCSTCRKLTRADVHFEHELGLHPTLIAALAACSLEQLRFRLAEGSRPLVPDDMCKCHTQETRVVHFEQSWDFIQHSCSTYCMLTRAPEDPTQMSEEWSKSCRHMSQCTSNVFAHASIQICNQGNFFTKERLKQEITCFSLVKVDVNFCNGVCPSAERYFAAVLHSDFQS